VLATSERGLDRREEVDLAALTGDVLRAASAGVAIEADLRPTRVTGDPVLIGRLVANLIDNAISYNVPDGRVEVLVTDGCLAGLCSGQRAASLRPVLRTTPTATTPNRRPASSPDPNTAPSRAKSP